MSVATMAPMVGPFYAQRRCWGAVVLGVVNASAAPNSFGAILSGNRTALAGESMKFALDVVSPREALCGARHPSVLMLRICVSAIPTARGLVAGDPDLYVSFSDQNPGMTSAEFVANHQGMAVLALASNLDEWLGSVSERHVCAFPADRGAGTEPMRAAFRGTVYGSVVMRQSGAVRLCASVLVQRAYV